MPVRTFSALALFVFLCFAGPSSQASEPTRVNSIRMDATGYSNVVVTIEGFATQWVEGRGTTGFYVLKDDWGDVIKIRTSQPRPEIGGRYRVTGPVGIDVVNHNDVYVSEESRESLPLPVGSQEDLGVADAATAQPTVPPAESPSTAVAGAPETGGSVWRRVLLFGGVFAAVLLLFGFAFWLSRARRSVPDLADTSIAAAASSETSLPQGQPIEGKTIKIFAPPAGTLKILPGRLDVVSGDDTVREIRFYRVASQTNPEITFGRLAGAPYTHVQLKPMTVSSRQAKLSLANGGWTLTNLAPPSSNPTRWNGRELGVDEQAVLRDGDRIDMGEVALVYRATA